MALCFSFFGGLFQHLTVLWWRVSLFNLIIPLCLQIWYPEINDSSITFQAHQPEKWITMTGPVSIPAELLESSSHIERNLGITTRIDRTMHDYVQNLLYIYIYILKLLYIYIYMIIICLLLYTMYTWSPWAGHFSKTERRQTGADCFGGAALQLSSLGSGKMMPSGVLNCEWIIP